MPLSGGHGGIARFPMWVLLVLYLLGTFEDVSYVVMFRHGIPEVNTVQFLLYSSGN